MHQKNFKLSMRLFAAAALMVFSSTGLFAQLSTGKVEGVVRDQDTGQPIEGAQVIVEGTRLGNVTNADGYYFILNVPPGNRDITFTYTGYQKTTVANTLILAGQTTTVNANLSSTVVEMEGITVEGETEVLMPRDNTVSKQRLTSERLEETPASRLEDMMILEAGVQIGGRDAMSRGLRIRGGRLGEEAMVVDGVMVRNFTANPFQQGQGWIFDMEVGSRSEDATPLEFSTESLEEVDILTGGFQAEYGNAQSGIINIVTKEGGPDFKGDVRYITDAQQPRTSDWGYNQLQASVSGPVLPVPDLYFHLSGEIQGEADRSWTHADEGFRGVDQDFVDRLNEAVRNDPVLREREGPIFSLEKFQTARDFYTSKVGGNKSLFSAPHPARLPHNWGDRTLGSGKLTYSPVQGLKFLSSINRSRFQHSYPNGWDGQGNYFQTGIFYEGDPDWERRDWGNDTMLHVHQAYGRKVRSTNYLAGADWDFYRSAERNASLQFRYTYFKSVENHNSSIKNNWERDTFLNWSMHDVQFEVERFPNREGAPDPSWWPDGANGWKQGVKYVTPFHQDLYTAYYMNYWYLRETQDNYKADVDFQIDRYNRAKLGFQMTTFDNLSFRTDYRTTERDPMNEFRYDPELYGAYIQNRTDLGDFVFNYGLRWDHFVPLANWGITRNNPWGESISPTAHSEWSPRFDVGFPVTDKAQLRFSYGVFCQLPSFSHMFDSDNPGGLEYARTDAFEAGLSYLMSDDMVADFVAYYRDVDGNVADKEFFVERYYWYTEELRRYWTEGPTNRDAGNIKGMDFTLRKRFSNNFSFNLMYTLQFSRTTGSAYNTPSLEGEIDPATGARYIPPDELRPIDGDRTHKLSYQLNYMFPNDYMAGTMWNKILGNFRAYGVFRLQSGEPMLDYGGSKWTRTDNANLTRDALGRRIGGLNFFRNRWDYGVDVRFSKLFNLGQRRRFTFFAEIFNLTNKRENEPYPSHYVLEGRMHGITGGVDLKWDELGENDPLRARFQTDFNGDGILTVEEAALGSMAIDMMNSTMDKRKWGDARRIRMGLDFAF